METIFSRNGTVSYSTVTPNRVARTSHAGTTGSLLPPGFFPAPAHLRSILGGMSSLPQAIQVMLDRCKQQTLVDSGGKYVILELQLLDYFVVEISDFAFWHVDLPLRASM